MIESCGDKRDPSELVLLNALEIRLRGAAAEPGAADVRIRRREWSAENEHTQGTHRRVLLVVLPDSLKAGIRHVEGDVVELTTVHAEAVAIALREDNGRGPALEVLYDHVPLILCGAGHPSPDCRVRHLVQAGVGRDDWLHDRPARPLCDRVRGRWKAGERMGRKGEKVRLSSRGEKVDGVDDRLAELTGRSPRYVVREVPAYDAIVKLLDGWERKQHHRMHQRITEPAPGLLARASQASPQADP